MTAAGLAASDAASCPPGDGEALASRPRDGGLGALASRVQALLPEIRRRAEETERLGTLPPDLFSALRQAGLFRILEPARFGGSELGFAVLAETNMTLGRACGSTAWLTCVLNGWWLLGCYAERAQQEVAAERPGAVIGAVFAPTTDVTPVEGGFRVSGRWPFSSGVDFMDYALLGGFVSGGGPPEVRMFLVPRRDFTVLDDWDVLGLRGTGSKTTVVDKAFIPEHRTLLLSALREGRGPGAALHPAPFYRVPFGAAFPVMLATPAVGVAAGALDEWAGWARGHVSRGTFSAAAYVPLQVRLGEAAAQVEAARALLRRHLAQIESDAAAGIVPGPDARAACWRDGAYAALMCRRAVQSLFEATGSTAIASRSPLQRAWRDLQTMTAHISLRWDEAAERFGRSALGFEPPNPFFY